MSLHQLWLETPAGQRELIRRERLARAAKRELIAAGGAPAPVLRPAAKLSDILGYSPLVANKGPKAA